MNNSGYQQRNNGRQTYLQSTLEKERRGIPRSIAVQKNGDDQADGTKNGKVSVRDSLEKFLADSKDEDLMFINTATVNDVRSYGSSTKLSDPTTQSDDTWDRTGKKASSRGSRGRTRSRPEKSSRKILELTPEKSGRKTTERRRRKKKEPADEDEDLDASFSILFQTSLSSIFDEGNPTAKEPKHEPRRGRRKEPREKKQPEKKEQEDEWDSELVRMFESSLDNIFDNTETEKESQLVESRFHSSLSDLDRVKQLRKRRNRSRSGTNPRSSSSSAQRRAPSLDKALAAPTTTRRRVSRRSRSQAGRTTMQPKKGSIHSDPGVNNGLSAGLSKLDREVRRDNMKKAYRSRSVGSRGDRGAESLASGVSRQTQSRSQKKSGFEGGALNAILGDESKARSAARGKDIASLGGSASFAEASLPADEEYMKERKARQESILDGQREKWLRDAKAEEEAKRLEKERREAEESFVRKLKRTLSSTASSSRSSKSSSKLKRDARKTGKDASKLRRAAEEKAKQRSPTKSRRRSGGAKEPANPSTTVDATSSPPKRPSSKGATKKRRDGNVKLTPKENPKKRLPSPSNQRRRSLDVDYSEVSFESERSQWWII